MYDEYSPDWIWQEQELEQRYYEEHTPHTPGKQPQPNCNRTHTGTNMKVSEQFSSNWLKAADLRGQPRTVTIQEVKLEPVGQDGEKMICYFAGKDKGLVLNKTNANTIAASLGDDTVGWGGRQIVLMSTKVPFQGQMVDAIRVSVPVDQQGSAQAAAAAPATSGADFDDDIPF